MTDQIKDGIITIEMVMLSIYNQPAAFIKGVYGLNSAQGDYFESKMTQAINNFGRWWNTLDTSARKNAISTAGRLYRDEATERMTIY